VGVERAGAGKGSMRGRGGVKAAGGRGREGVEVLCYGVVDGRAGEAEEIYKMLGKGGRVSWGRRASEGSRGEAELWGEWWMWRLRHHLFLCLGGRGERQLRPDEVRHGGRCLKGISWYTCIGGLEVWMRSYGGFALLVRI
jgi:hypothetical protein